MENRRRERGYRRRERVTTDPNYAEREFCCVWDEQRMSRAASTVLKVPENGRVGTANDPGAV